MKSDSSSLISLIKFILSNHEVCNESLSGRYVNPNNIFKDPLLTKYLDMSWLITGDNSPSHSPRDTSHLMVSNSNISAGDLGTFPDFGGSRYIFRPC